MNVVSVIDKFLNDKKGRSIRIRIETELKERQLLLDNKIKKEDPLE